MFDSFDLQFSPEDDTAMEDYYEFLAEEERKQEKVKEKTLEEVS